MAIVFLSRGGISKYLKPARMAKVLKYFCSSTVNGCCVKNSGKICINGSSSKSNKVFMVDEPLLITVNGLKPKQNITLRATSTSGGSSDTLFQSFAHFEADVNGCVNAKDHESKGGTYHGAEPMGLFWSMIPLKNKDITVMRMMHKDVHKPVQCRLELFDNFVDFGVESYSDLAPLQESLSPMESKSIERWYHARDTVSYERVETGRLRGEVFIPKHPRKCQGIIDLFGSAGGLLSFRAALLASHGFATYALPFFGYDDLPRDANSLDIEYFEEAIEWFLAHPNVKDDGIGIIATSFGVSLALLLATRSKNRVKASVCINGSDWLILHPISIGGTKLDPLTADVSQGHLSSDGFLITKNFFFSEEQRSCQPSAQIPIETMSGKLLYLASGDDHNFNSGECAAQIFRRLKECGKENILESVIYPGTGHLLEPPYTNHCRHSFHKTYNLNLSFGGDALNHAKAQEDAWNRIIKFFRNSVFSRL